jgi:hypothetical protein
MDYIISLVILLLLTPTSIILLQETLTLFIVDHVLLISKIQAFQTLTREYLIFKSQVSF